MGKLYDSRLKIEKHIADKGLDAMKTKGAINLKMGFMLTFLTATSPDDAAKFEKMRKAAKEVLNLDL